MKKTSAFFVLLLLAGCDNPPQSASFTDVESDGKHTFIADVWADNWFSFSLEKTQMLEDSVSITTERSFNAESFRFKADYPLQLNFVIKDFKENDTGLEYIGARNQQMGDGGFIAQFRHESTGAIVAVTNSSWRCLVTHHAPTDKSCESLDQPVVGEGPCGSAKTDAPIEWQTIGFDDSAWISASEYSESEVDPKHGYDAIDWDDTAHLIWTGDLEQDNTLLCRLTVEEP
ncbi:MAG: PEBP family protein [Pseudomonadota bacterium]